jgi:hypothetical protein
MRDRHSQILERLLERGALQRNLNNKRTSVSRDEYEIPAAAILPAAKKFIAGKMGECNLDALDLPGTAMQRERRSRGIHGSQFQRSNNHPDADNRFVSNARGAGGRGGTRFRRLRVKLSGIARAVR